MKNDDRIDRFERFKRLRYRQTDQPTDGHDLLQKCEDALKKHSIELPYSEIADVFLEHFFGGSSKRK